MRLKITRVRDQNGNEREIRSVRAFNSRTFVPFDPEIKPNETELDSQEGGVGVVPPSSPEEEQVIRISREWEADVDNVSILEPLYQDMRDIRDLILSGNTTKIELE